MAHSCNTPARRSPGFGNEFWQVPLAWFHRLQEWNNQRYGKSLAGLDAHLARDIGLDPEDPQLKRQAWFSEMPRHRGF